MYLGVILCSSLSYSGLVEVIVPTPYNVMDLVRMGACTGGVCSQELHF